MPLMKSMKGHDWGICTNCVHFQGMGSWSECKRDGDPFSKDTRCDLFEPVGSCDTCIHNRGEFHARGRTVVECQRNGDDSDDVVFTRKNIGCRRYRKVENQEGA